MNDAITIEHHLTSFQVTKEPESVPTLSGKKLVLTRGSLYLPEDRTCPHCSGYLDVHQHHEVSLQHLPLFTKTHMLKIDRVRLKCRCCGYMEYQKIPFKASRHRITGYLKAYIMKYLSQGYTLKEVSQILDVNPSVVKTIDKERLEFKFRGRAPEYYSKHIGIDEFLLHKRHRYATVVIDLDTGDVLFCEEGKKKEQVYHFFEQMGCDWMSHVRAVAMDMNAQYDSAFREKAPHVKIVYDLFHVVKLYNDKVLTAMRRRKQRELKEAGDTAGYQLFKGSRFLLTSNRSTLQERDAQAQQNNQQLYEAYESKGLSLPPGARRIKADREKRLDDLLSVNTDFCAAYILLEQLKMAFKQSSRSSLESGMKQWIKLAKQSGVEEIRSYTATIESHLVGILNHADCPVSNGKLEGTNNLIKTIRRKSYGIPDTQYFFLKIMEASRRPYRQYKSHKKLC
jgi:transposase